MRIFAIVLSACAIGLTSAAPARAEINVFACEPEWGALTLELGGDKVSIYIATTGKQDPHQVQARPSLIAKARQADIAVCTGAELEIGWMPMIVRQAANPRILPGGAGAFDATRYVQLRDIPNRLDRADGDVHAAGNPHIQTDPRNILPVAKPLSDRLAQLDPAHAAYYAARYADFAARWTAALDRWRKEAAPLQGIPVAVQHKNWTYLLDWLGLREVVALEPKPGVPASSGHLAQVLVEIKRQPVRMVIHAAYEDPKPSEFLAERAGIPIVELPFTVGGANDAADLVGLYDATVSRLIAGLRHVPR